MAEYNLDIPLEEKDVCQVKLGDLIYFSGSAWTCRSRLLKYVFEEGKTLPFSTERKNLLIHVGPVVVKEAEQWRLVSFAPTSSIRFEKWGAKSIAEWGLRAIVGKTTMGNETAFAMKKNKCIHATPVGVAPNLMIDRIKIKDVFWFKELGSIEAAWQLELDRLGPFMVDIDSEGRNHFNELDQIIEDNRKKAFARLNIAEDFEYTKLY